jgi:hypothetical protein
MASGYMYEEALELHTKYFALFPCTLVTQVWDRKEKKTNARELLQGWGKSKTLVGMKCFTSITMPDTT